MSDHLAQVLLFPIEKAKHNRKKEICKRDFKNLTGNVLIGDLQIDSGLEKLGFLVLESPYSSKQVQENVRAPRDFTRYLCLPHHVRHCAPNEICYGKINQCNNILQFSHVKSQR